jgi:endonuclease/exonuclease/phosphatase (EEP) superfamily protein YafD
VALAGVFVIAALEWGLLLIRPEHGPLAVLQVLAPHLALAGLALVPFSLLEVRPASIVTGVVLAVVVGLRFGGDWVSGGAPSPGAARGLEVITWNLEVGATSAAASVEFLRAHDADIVALQELQPEAAAAIEADPALVSRYPYRALNPRRDVLGLGILSRVPIIDATFELDPAVQEARLDLGGGRTIALINAHPMHAEMQLLANLPIGLDSTIRNADLELIRGRIDVLVERGLPVVLLGDLNTASSEPAFERFVDGLRDVHAEVGFGTGWTWRPSRLEFLGLGLVRIDHVIVSPEITPLSIGGACPPVGDHCLVNARVAIPDGNSD